MSRPLRRSIIKEYLREGDVKRLRKNLGTLVKLCGDSDKNLRIGEKTLLVRNKEEGFKEVFLEKDYILKLAYKEETYKDNKYDASRIIRNYTAIDILISDFRSSEAVGKLQEMFKRDDGEVMWDCFKELFDTVEHGADLLMIIDQRKKDEEEERKRLASLRSAVEVPPVVSSATTPSTPISGVVVGIPVSIASSLPLVSVAASVASATTPAAPLVAAPSTVASTVTVPPPPIPSGIVADPFSRPNKELEPLYHNLEMYKLPAVQGFWSLEPNKKRGNNFRVLNGVYNADTFTQGRLASDPFIKRVGTDDEAVTMIFNAMIAVAIKVASNLRFVNTSDGSIDLEKICNIIAEAEEYGTVARAPSANPEEKKYSAMVQEMNGLVGIYSGREDGLKHNDPLRNPLRMTFWPEEVKDYFRKKMTEGQKINATEIASAVQYFDAVKSETQKSMPAAAGAGRF